MIRLERQIGNFLYYFERSWPYVISFILTVFIYYLDVKLYENIYFNDSVDAIVTVDSIIIGFIGALMPMIISMKNESKFVRYVFEKDEKSLFKKYFKMAIKIGFLNLTISIVLYVRESFKEPFVISFLYILWVFTSILFFGLTLRSMSYMVELIFNKEVEAKNRPEKLADSKNSAEQIEATKKKFSK